MAAKLVELNSDWNFKSTRKNKRGNENSTKQILMVTGNDTGFLIITLILDLCSESIEINTGPYGSFRNKDS